MKDRDHRDLDFAAQNTDLLQKKMKSSPTQNPRSLGDLFCRNGMQLAVCNDQAAQDTDTHHVDEIKRQAARIVAASPC